MSQVITAIYEHGVLHPVTPLRLKEHQRVKVQIVPDSPQETVNDVLQWLTSIGRLTPPYPPKGKAPVAETKRAQLSHILGEAAQKPLSEIILEDRDER
jgi:predicted DNA-binding antitoxin AbrB/MazE fold protein